MSSRGSIEQQHDRRDIVLGACGEGGVAHGLRGAIEGGAAACAAQRFARELACFFVGEHVPHAVGGDEREPEITGTS